MKTTLKNPAIITLCFVIIALFAVTGCDSVEKPVVENPDGYVLYAQVRNPSRFSDVAVVKLVIWDRTGRKVELARGDWKGDGFRIVLPKTLNPNRLHTLINNNDINRGFAPTMVSAPSTITISNKNVRVVNASFLAFDRAGNQITYFFLSKVDENGNISPGGITYFTYVDSDVSIFGYNKREVLGYPNYHWIDTPTPVLFQKTSTYSIEWEKGWNVWRFTGGTDFLNRAKREEWTTIPMSKLIWNSNKR